MIGKIMLRSLLAATVAGWVGTARADNINLVPFGNVNWNIQSNPSGISENIAIENQAVSADKVFSGSDLGVSFTSVSGTGKLAVASYTDPPAPEAADFYPTFPPAGTEPDTGAGTGVLISNTSESNSNFSVPTTPVNLVTMEFDVGSEMPTPGSEFDVWAVGAATQGGDTDYVNVNFPGVSFPYANTGPLVSNGNVLLGTITITAVPEPGSLVLLGVAGAGFVVYYARRRIRRRPAQM